MPRLKPTTPAPRVPTMSANYSPGQMFPKLLRSIGYLCDQSSFQIEPVRQRDQFFLTALVLGYIGNIDRVNT